MRVLIIEDSITVRIFLKRYVAECFPQALLDECADGAQAISHLRQGAADLVITDLQMPHLGGEEFLQRSFAAGLLKGSAVMIISSAITPRIREALKDLPRVNFLRKPATGDEVSSAMRALLAGPTVLA